MLKDHISIFIHKSDKREFVNVSKPSVNIRTKAVRIETIRQREMIAIIDSDKIGEKMQIG
jgi:hypothetical protein